MKLFMRTNLLFSLLVVSFFSIYQLEAQETYGIQFPKTNSERDEKCKTCLNLFRQKPKEVRFSIKREKNNLYFHITDKKWYNQLFKNEGDGIAIDVVAKDYYSCDKDSIAYKQIKGRLLKPIYASKLKSGLKPHGNNGFRVLVGQISNTEIKKELEYNILFLNNKFLCRYYWVYDLESYQWDLLDMGMYLDSLTYNTKQIKASAKEGYILRNKTLKFKIPFKKNKSAYSQQDIKPIYDSLRLTDFNIKTINIKAYSSVEGSLKRNIELQQERANSIVAALQTFQKPTIKTKVSSSENWVEFLNDVKSTKFEYLSRLKKHQVKAKLVGTLSKTIEPILRKHRKAVLELELEKKDKYKTMSPSELIVKFNTSIKTENLEQAVEIQNSLFEKLKNEEAPLDILRRMEIPKQAKFVKILNKNAAYKYVINIRQALIAHNELLELEKLAPKNGEIKYNIAAIKIKMWRYKAMEINEDKLKNEILVLKNYGISSSLISRMMVNYHIIKAENLMRKRDYANKDKSVGYIKNSYKKFYLSNYDYLSLAQFFSYYANVDMAVELLKDKAKSIDIDENLLFYYLNLTLIDNELTKSNDYRTILLNAININKARFCKLFNTIQDGGVTFQLLDNKYLRGTYCENCVE